MNKYYVNSNDKSVMASDENEIVIRQHGSVTRYSGTNVQEILDSILKTHPDFKEVDKVEYEYYLVKFDIVEPKEDTAVNDDIRDEFSVNMDKIEQEFNCPCDMCDEECEEECEENNVFCFHDENDNIYYRIEQLEDGSYDVDVYNANEKTSSHSTVSHFFINGNQISEEEWAKGINQKKSLPVSKYYYYRNATIDTDYLYCVVYRPNGDINSIITMAINGQRLQITINADSNDCQRWFDRYSKDWKDLSSEMFKECYQYAYQLLQKFGNFLDNE